ncbi:TIGR00366 family protein [Algoriphagus sp. CAU 1675]|nr:TIGR00366 family protein [Algoriphagus sp. CAU 1675]MDF2158169.1 TIGR00366 family protein [Algoriphagus sp. CAU 1675]
MKRESPPTRRLVAIRVTEKGLKTNSIQLDEFKYWLKNLKLAIKLTLIIIYKFKLKKSFVVLSAKNKRIFEISPFGIVLFLTVLCMVLAYFTESDPTKNFLDKTIQVLNFWQNGFFGLMDFTLQMMMILVFGYALAIYKPFHSILRKLSRIPSNSLQAILFTGLITMMAGLINWGFGLVVGALLARFVYLALEEKGVESNPVLIASAGYLGMAIWHGGLSGSAPLKVAEKGHFLESEIGVIPVSETLFTRWNFMLTGGLILVFILTLLLLSYKKEKVEKPVYSHPLRPVPPGEGSYLARIAGVIMMGIVFLKIFENTGFGLGFFNLNLVNFFLFALTLIAYRSLKQFTEATSEGIKSSVDIFIQFPFYAGIMGLVTHSSLLAEISGYFISTTSSTTLPVLTLISSAFVNLLVPSGGGQWAVQGPILMKASETLSLSSGKMVMIFSYGDQISNLLQPFWALPLLAITGIKARQLLKYCGWLFISGFSYLLLSVYFLF